MTKTYLTLTSSLIAFTISLSACDFNSKTAKGSGAVGGTEVSIKPVSEIKTVINSFAHEIDITALRAETPSQIPDGCTAISAPTTLSASGKYCLTNSIVVDSQNQPGIVIAANDVTLDLMGHSIVSTDLDTIGAGVSIADKENIVIKGGSVSGFLTGISAQNVTGLDVSEMALLGNQWRGIRANGKALRITKNQVGKMEGHVGYSDSPPVGIDVQGSDCAISANTVMDIKPMFWNDVTGISQRSGADACVLSDNIIKPLPESYCRPVRRVTTITESGSFCLTKDLDIAEMNRNGISLAADNITLDLSGFTISGPGNGTTGSGVRSEGFTNVTVKNGRITGFARATGISPASEATVIDIVEQ